MALPIKKTPDHPRDDKSPLASPGQVMRQQAEEIARLKAVNSHEDVKRLSPEEISKMLHELQVHQIELEMQNEELRRSEYELEIARERYFDIFDLAPVGYCTINENGLILEANLTAAGMMGVARDALGRQLFTRFVLKDDQDFYYLHRKQLTQSGALQDFELRMVKQDGTIFWAHLAATLAQDANGAQVCRITFSNITDRKQAEAALHNSEKLYRGIGESIDYGVWVCDPDGRNIYASESFLKLVGITQVQCSNFGWGDVLHPDDAEHTLTAWKECVRTGGNWDMEHRFRGVDGKWHPILARGVPIRNEQGQIISWAGINLDISRIKQAEEALQTALGRFQRIFDSNIIGIVTARADGSILEANDYYLGMLGYTQADLKAGDMRWTELTPPEFVPMDEIALHELDEKGTCRPYEKQYFRRDGSRIWVLIADSMLPGGKKDIVALVTDISAQKSLEASLASQRDKLSIANEKLAQDLIERKLVEAQLTDQLDELRRWYDATLDREGRVIELKREVNQLLAQTGHPPRYPSAEAESRSEE